MSPYDAFNHDTQSPKAGDGRISSALIASMASEINFGSSFPGPTVIINGNFCIEGSKTFGFPGTTRICNGEFVVDGTLEQPPTFLAISSPPNNASNASYEDWEDYPENSGTAWYYLGYDPGPNPQYSFLYGRQCNTYNDAPPTQFGLGGLFNDHYADEGNSEAANTVGYFEETDASDLDNMVFSAMSHPGGFANNLLVADCGVSGVGNFSFGKPKVLVLDGNTSVALVRANPEMAGGYSFPIKGGKHFIGNFDYVISTYLVFSIKQPRGEE